MTEGRPRDSHEAFVNRELSWLGFARRVLALCEDESLPLLERVKFAGIMGMLHDEFFMKRISGLKRQIGKGSRKISIDGRTPSEEFTACRELLAAQDEILSDTLERSILPALTAEGIPILSYDALDKSQRKHLRGYFKRSVQPILTPLAVDAEHPFPFISNLSFNLAALVPGQNGDASRFIRIKVPNNRPRWVPLPGDAGFVPLEQVIAANLDTMFPGVAPNDVYTFRVIRGASGDPAETEYASSEREPFGVPGRIVDVVSNELKARRFAGVVRVQVDPAMPKSLVKWLVKQLQADKIDVYRTRYFLGVSELLQFEIPDRPDLRFPPHEPRMPERLAELEDSPTAIFQEIDRGDILLHHPYDSFEGSVLRFLQSAAIDPQVLAIKLTIYRTGSDSPIVRALAEASRRGKQVAVLVEITARFDEAPNIAWGRYLEKEGVHVAYGVERLKTHVKLALVVREQGNDVRRYAHIGTGNYNVGTAAVYEDLGLLTSDPEICGDVAEVFNALTGAQSGARCERMLVAPQRMRSEFTALIRREAEHAREGRSSGIYAKMNQLQDPDIIRELYDASRAGVPIRINVRGLCCLRPGVPGLSETIEVHGLVGRFLEHSRLYRFVNDGDHEYYMGSADWMKRNLDNRFETIVPILDPAIRAELDRVIAVYDSDNASMWDCGADGLYRLRRPDPGEPRIAAQEVFSREAEEDRSEPELPSDLSSRAV
jgi:polyphosphate kinase